MFFFVTGTLLMTPERRKAIWAIYGEFLHETDDFNNCFEILILINWLVVSSEFS